MVENTLGPRRRRFLPLPDVCSVLEATKTAAAAWKSRSGMEKLEIAET